MFLVLMVKNLGLMWVAIEATTLVSAFLVSFKFTRSALEATWKYVMVCTVGICLALLGTMIDPFTISFKTEPFSFTDNSAYPAPLS